jgi:hypothetical protein
MEPEGVRCVDKGVKLHFLRRRKEYLPIVIGQIKQLNSEELNTLYQYKRGADKIRRINTHEKNQWRVESLPYQYRQTDV